MGRRVSEMCFAIPLYNSTPPRLGMVGNELFPPQGKVRSVLLGRGGSFICAETIPHMIPGDRGMRPEHRVPVYEPMAAG